MPAFLGLDIGTQGARALACQVSEKEEKGGRVVAQAARPFPPGTIRSDTPPGHAEQSPLGWWRAAGAALRQVTAQIPPDSIRALSVTSTSGTLCLLDAGGQPLLPALMYNDARASQEAAQVQAAGADLAIRMGYRFNASFALAKLLWLAHYHPDILDRARYICHAADFLVGRLSGVYDVTDYSNALKTGYDLSPGQGGSFADRWPDFIGGELNLPIGKLPRVVAPGTVIGGVTREAARITGLRPGTPLVAGMTDGCAGQIAAGAVAPGDWNSTLGTTLVVKGVTERLVRDPQGRIYSHRHPDGYWLPGGASNVGGEALTARFPAGDLAALDARAAKLVPTNLIAYPLARRGERFPFVHAGAEGFFLPFSTQPTPNTRFLKEDRFWEAADPATPYAACLEGVAYLERLAYETLESLGARLSGVIRVAGGGARSEVWMQIRADVLNRELSRPAETGAAMGAAILAASRTYFTGLIPAARAMVQVEKRVVPRPALIEPYEARYRRFRAACVERGYINT